MAVRSDETLCWRDVFKDDIAEVGEIAVIVRAARLEIGYSQARFAFIVGCEVEEIQRIETGGKVSLNLAKKLGHILNRDYRVFLEESR